jgi:hypothetical protein
MVTRREDFLFKKSEAKEQADFARSQGRKTRVIKVGVNEFRVTDVGKRKVKKTKTSKRSKSSSKEVGRSISKGIKFLEGGMEGLRLPRIKKFTREELTRKLTERRLRTQARIERAKILRTPERLR